MVLYSSTGVQDTERNVYADNGQDRISSRARGLARYLPQASVILITGGLYMYIQYYAFFPTEIHQQRNLVLSGASYRKLGDDSQIPWRVRHAEELTCDFAYQHVDTKCPRFVHLPVTWGGGLGNKFFTHILGLMLAIDMKATYLYDGASYSREEGQDHGRYPWVEDTFQLGYREVDLQQVKLQPEEVSLKYDDLIYHHH